MQETMLLLQIILTCLGFLTLNNTHLMSSISGQRGYVGVKPLRIMLHQGMTEVVAVSTGTDKTCKAPVRSPPTAYHTLSFHWPDALPTIHSTYPTNSVKTALPDHFYS